MQGLSHRDKLTKTILFFIVKIFSRLCCWDQRVQVMISYLVSIALIHRSMLQLICFSTKLASAERSVCRLFLMRSTILLRIVCQLQRAKLVVIIAANLVNFVVVRWYWWHW